MCIRDRTYAEACLGNSEELAGGPGLEALNQVRDRARIPRKERVTFEDIIRERRVEFSMEYCNWYDMVSWYHWKPDYMLNYFQNQHRGYTVDLIVKDEDGYLHFGKMCIRDRNTGPSPYSTATKHSNCKASSEVGVSVGRKAVSMPHTAPFCNWPHQ